jgi:hypothetical protein
MKLTRRYLLSFIPVALLARFKPFASGGVVPEPKVPYIVGEGVCNFPASMAARDVTITYTAGWPPTDAVCVLANHPIVSIDSIMVDDKTYKTCLGKFQNNFVFKGEPWIPPPDLQAGISREKVAEVRRWMDIQCASGIEKRRANVQTIGSDNGHASA